MEQAVIALKGVSRVFITDEVETHAIEGVNLEIGRGEYVCIAGPSGCGKSTLLSVIGLLDEPTSGECWLEGQSTTTLSPRQRAACRNARIGFIFQSFNLLGDLNVFDNVELPLRYRGLKPGERRRRIEEVLERVGMTHRRWHYPAQLSGGQQQRVAVARALVGEPSILLADEPTGNLDSASGEAVMTLLGELHRSGKTICMVTHDTRFAQYAQRKVHLMDGRIVHDTAGEVGDAREAREVGTAREGAHHA